MKNSIIINSDLDKNKINAINQLRKYGYVFKRNFTVS